MGLVVELLFVVGVGGALMLVGWAVADFAETLLGDGSGMTETRIVSSAGFVFEVGEISSPQSVVEVGRLKSLRKCCSVIDEWRF